MGAQRFTVGLAALLFAASLSQTATADLSSVKAAIAEGKTETVIEELKTLAAGKSPEAQMLLARLHLKGDGVPKNQSLAFGWYLRAAEGGNADAQFKIAEMHLRGIGTPVNVRAAARGLEKAAKQDHLDANARLGLIHSPLHGHFLRDAKKSLKYLTAAANLGSIRAEQALDELRDAGFIAAEEEEAQLLDPNSPAGRIQALFIDGVDTLNAHMQGMSLIHRGHIRVTPKDDGTYEVAVPRARIRTDTGTKILFGTLRLDVRPIGELREDGGHEAYEFSGIPSPRLLVASDLLREDVVVTHKPKQLKGRWLTDVATFADFSVETDDVAIGDSAGSFEIAIGSASKTSDAIKVADGRYDLPISVSVGNLLFRSQMAGLTVRLGRGALDGELNGLALPRYLDMLRRSVGGPVAMLGIVLQELKDQSPDNPMLSGENFRWEIDGLRIVDDEKGGVISLAKADFGAQANDLDKPLNRFILTFGHQGLAAPAVAEKAAGLAPVDSRFSVSVDNVPGWQAASIIVETTMQGLLSGQLLASGGRANRANEELGRQTLERLAQLFAEAEVRVDVWFSVASEGAKVGFDGSFQADNASATGFVADADLVIEGYDRIIEKGAEASGFPSEMITDQLSQYVDPKDREGGVLRFRVEQDRSGRVTVNGRELTGMPGWNM